MLLGTHRAFLPRTSFQASPPLAIKDIQRPPKPPPALPVGTAYPPKPPPKAILNDRDEIEYDEEGYVKCRGQVRAKPLAADGYFPVPCLMSALDILLGQADLIDCLAGGTVKALMNARQTHVFFRCAVGKSEGGCLFYRLHFL